MLQTVETYSYATHTDSFAPILATVIGSGSSNFVSKSGTSQFVAIRNLIPCFYLLPSHMIPTCKQRIRVCSQNWEKGSGSIYLTGISLWLTNSIDEQYF
jgi:hypothetical protein